MIGRPKESDLLTPIQSSYNHILRVKSRVNASEKKKGTSEISLESVVGSRVTSRKARSVAKRQRHISEAFTRCFTQTSASLPACQFLPHASLIPVRDQIFKPSCGWRCRSITFVRSFSDDLESLSFVLRCNPSDCIYRTASGIDGSQ